MMQEPQTDAFLVESRLTKIKLWDYHYRIIVCSRPLQTINV